jgi:hypothetical protein
VSTNIIAIYQSRSREPYHRGNTHRIEVARKAVKVEENVELKTRRRREEKRKRRAKLKGLFILS